MRGDDKPSRGTSDRARGSSGAPRHHLPTDDDARAGATAAGAGVAATEPQAAARSGEDTRRRGWFWHWNGIVTQYAPLIGLKGIGLLNSYTVWTDRREESPHRGFAFPSQQAEADFYGEERSELITINKILVALDLVEIRKEMLLRVDERGRRWRVPHNLYRVKDRPNGVTLRADDVLRVAELAQRDEAVFRYVRRVFSERFRPIDRDNVWHEILAEVRAHPTWQALQARAIEIERRASARARAGHRTRAGAPAGDSAFDCDEQAGQAAGASPTSVAVTNNAVTTATTIVAADSNGSAVAVAGGNDGSPGAATIAAALSSNGQASAVAPSNSTYHQPPTTTMTTTDTQDDERAPVAASASEPVAPQPERARPRTAGEWTQAARRATGDEVPEGDEQEEWGADAESSGGALDRDTRAPVRDATRERGRPGAGADTGDQTGERRLAGAEGHGPLVDPSPLVVSIFEAANDRRATTLERELLGELERAADPVARAAGSSGAEWVAAAVREAVAAGSRFVAPRRIQEILSRWAREGGPASIASAALGGLVAAHPAAEPPVTPRDDEADVRLPAGASGAAVWAATLADLAGAFDRETFARLLAGSRITRYWRGTVEVRVATVAAAEKLSQEYRTLVERRLNQRLRRPVAVHFCAPEPEAGAESHTAAPSPASDAASAFTLSAADAEMGRQLWEALRPDLATLAGEEDATRLGGIVVLGEDSSGAVLLGAPSPLVARLVAGRCRAAVEQALGRLLQREVRVRALLPGDWRVAG